MKYQDVHLAFSPNIALILVISCEFPKIWLYYLLSPTYPLLDQYVFLSITFCGYHLWSSFCVPGTELGALKHQPFESPQ
jgi:hypothetical protein